MASAKQLAVALVINLIEKADFPHYNHSRWLLLAAVEIRFVGCDSNELLDILIHTGLKSSMNLFVVKNMFYQKQIIPTFLIPFTFGTN